MNFNERQIPPPKHWQQFEDLCLSIFRNVWGDPTAQKNGRSGQQQHGTDVSDFVRALETVRVQFPGMNELAQQDLAAKIVTEDMGMCWPPQSSRIIGVEVKCGYFDEQDGPQSDKSSASKTKRLRQRIGLLLEMGFDAVGLLDVVGNEPARGPGAFLEAGWRARQSARAFQPIIEARLTDDIPAAHFCWAVGSVFDRDERFGGGGGLLTVRRGLPNPLIQDGNSDAVGKRNIMLQNVAKMLATISVPRYCPVFFIDCQHCGRLHFLEDATCVWEPRARARRDRSPENSKIV